MRRIILAAFAIVLLHAAPSMAAECTNLALVANGGRAVASSEYSPGYPISQLNNGTRAGSPWWDATPSVYPDWAGIDWESTRTIDRIVVRLPTGYDANPFTLGRARIQYWDGTDWEDVDAAGYWQDNPVEDWPTSYYPTGIEVKAWDLATPVSTSRIRVLIEEGTRSGGSSLEEIEAYLGSDCDLPGPAVRAPLEECVNVALDGTATASSVHGSSYPVSGVNNGRRESGSSRGYWNDGTNGVWPDWVQISWSRAQTLDRVVARIPLARREFPLGEITLRRTRIQYWDDNNDVWVDLAGRGGQDNPIIDWQGPIEVYDGSESRVFDLLSAIRTTKIRVLVENGASDGWSWLDELEAYSCGEAPEAPATPRNVNLALTANGGRAVASSEYSPLYPISQINNGSSAGNAWWDATPSVYPDWAGIDWEHPRTINRIVVRLPWGVDPSAYTYGRIRVQYWGGGSWVDAVDSGSEPNPAINWAAPYYNDASRTKRWDLATAVEASRVRIRYEVGPSSGWSLLDEIEAWWIV